MDRIMCSSMEKNCTIYCWDIWLVCKVVSFLVLRRGQKLFYYCLWSLSLSNFRQNFGYHFDASTYYISYVSINVLVFLLTGAIQFVVIPDHPLFSLTTRKDHLNRWKKPFFQIRKSLSYLLLIMSTAESYRSEQVL